MINQQGRINFADLDNYKIKGEGLDLGEQYWENAIKEVMASEKAVGVIYGGVVTVVAALTVNISKGLALFSNGLLVTWDSQNVALAAASAVNPRYDRIELGYSLANNTAVLNNDNAAKTLDKIHVATAAALAGVAAGSPAVPARTAGKLSLAVIHVAANQVALAGGDIDSTEDTYRDLSYTLLGTSPVGIRYNTRLGVLQSTTDGATWKALAGGPTKVITFADSPYTVTPQQPVLEVNTAGGNVVVNLPALASGFPIEITKTSADVNAVIPTPNGAETINGQVSDSIDAQWSNKVYRPLSTAWVIR